MRALDGIVEIPSMRGVSEGEGISIDMDVILTHASDRESFYRLLSTDPAIEVFKFCDSGRERIETEREKTRETVLNDLGHRAAGTSQDGGAAGEGFDHHESKWLRPIDRKHESERIPQKVRFFGVVDFTDKLNVLSI